MRQPVNTKIMMMTGITLTTLLFQNFQVVETLRRPKRAVDSLARVQHAKELLGRSYKGSIAQEAEKIKDLHITIYEDVLKLLPAEYSDQALALSETIINEAEKNNFDPVFIMAVIKTESSFNPLALGSAGEIGLMQIKPKTAEEVAIKNNIEWRGPNTLKNPVMNVRIGVAYFTELRDKFSGYANKYISSYNMGAAKVRKLYKNDVTPKEYSIRVLTNYKAIYKRMIATRSTTIVEASSVAQNIN